LPHFTFEQVIAIGLLAFPDRTADLSELSDSITKIFGWYTNRTIVPYLYLRLLNFFRGIQKQHDRYFEQVHPSVRNKGQINGLSNRLLVWTLPPGRENLLFEALYRTPLLHFWRHATAFTPRQRNERASGRPYLDGLLVELRLKILGHCLSSQVPLKVLHAAEVSRPKVYENWELWNRQFNGKALIALSSINKSLRNDALLAVFKTNKIVLLQSDSSRATSIRDWLQSLRHKVTKPEDNSINASAEITEPQDDLTHVPLPAPNPKTPFLKSAPT
jgi:hypothetical protein